MVILRKRHILTSTALVLIIATPFISMATDTNKLAAAPAVGTHPASVLAAAPMTDVPATARAPSAPETAANSAGAAELLTPINETEQGGSLAAIDAVDRAVAEKIRDLLGSKTDRFFASANERTAVVAFYESRSLAPLWVENGVENARAEAIIARLKSADSDGLDPSKYIAPNFASLGPDALAEAELRLTQIVLTYARHLQAGRFPYTRVSRNIELPQVAPAPADVLNAVANASRMLAKRSTNSARSRNPIGGSRRCWRTYAAGDCPKAKTPGRSIPLSPTWSAGAGIHASSEVPMCLSICRTSPSRSCTTASRRGRRGS